LSSQGPGTSSVVTIWHTSRHFLSIATKSVFCSRCRTNGP